MPAGIRVDEFWPHSSQVQALEVGPRWSWATPLQVLIHCTAETSTSEVEQGLARRVCSGKRQLLLLDQAHSKWKSEGCFREGGGVCLSWHCCRQALFSDLTRVSPSSTWGGGGRGAAILCLTRENTRVQAS